VSWQAPTPVVADLLVGPVRRHAGGTLEVRLGPGLPAAAPGQFVMVDVGDGALAHPFTVFRTLEGAALSLLLRPGGRPVEALLGRVRGAPVRTVGPLGRPFPHPDTAGRAFAVAESGRTAPLYELVRLLVDEGRPTTMLIGGERPEHFAAQSAFRALGAGVERCGGAGFPALERALAQATPADVLYIAGPEAALARANAAIVERGAPTAHLALEVAMACGVGACYGCPVPLAAPEDARHPYARACFDGPVFAAGEVAFA
jgi:dihydroorotate dehydrogenase electron transfer subunit